MKRVGIVFVVVVWGSFVCFGAEAKLNGELLETIKTMWLQKDFASLNKIAEQRLKKDPLDPIGALIKMDVIIAANYDVKALNAVKSLLLKHMKAEEDTSIRNLFRLYLNDLEMLLSLPKERQEKIRKQWNSRIVDVTPTHILVQKLFERTTRIAMMKKKSSLKPEGSDDIDLVTLWNSKDDARLLSWVKSRSPGDVAAALVCLDLNILKGVSAASLKTVLDHIETLIETIMQEDPTFLEGSEDYLRAFRAMYPILISEITAGNVSVEEMRLEWDKREVVPPAVRLSQEILKREKTKYKE